MSILQEAIQASLGLTLTVSGGEWAAESLTIWGSGWNFSTMSSWRLVRDDRVVCSCLHEPECAGEHLRDRQLEAVTGRPGAAVDDINLSFDSGYVLEVFSDLAVEPWVLHLPGGTYVPSDIHD
jgi:hypothetical protein